MDVLINTHTTALIFVARIEKYTGFRISFCRKYVHWLEPE